MPNSIPTLHADDPVSTLINRSTLRPGFFPVPLIATSYDITFAGGLAAVTVRRTFRNQEAHTIEATLTFPVPVHAVLYALEARIGGRTVTAVAKARAAAREDYEDAVDRGRTAALHEELLRGIHMLSVAHVAPGAEIEVTARFAQALAWIDGRAMLRIPTTVGDVYGASGLPDSDEPIHGGPVTAADLRVVCRKGTTALIGGKPVDGPRRIFLDRPIAIEVQGWSASEIRGRTAAGEPFTLSVSPVPEGDGQLDIAVLVDHSGSMHSLCTTGARISKHSSVLVGLSEVIHGLDESDRINLWQFDDTAEDIGTAHGKQVSALIRMLSPPRGGTEIGGAIETLLSHRGVRDIVLVTDGKSHALDIQKLAGRGVRFSVVLIGEDSLEANVGHLAALTGGEIFVVDGADMVPALKSVVASLRAMKPGRTDAEDGADLLRCRRSGMAIVATRDTADAEADAPGTARAAAAFVAGLRLATLPTAEAMQLAEAEGLVTHLTSLILVDEEGAAQAGLPAMRKVALPTPRASVAAVDRQAGLRCDASEVRMPAMARVSRCYSHRDGDDEPPRRSLRLQRAVDRGTAIKALESRLASRDPSLETSGSQAPRLTDLPRRIDWRNEGQRLVEGNLIGLPHDVADAIDAAARVGVVNRAAKRIGVSARVLVIGLLARVVSGSDRYAERVYRAILARAKTRDIASAAEHLGLSADAIHP